MFKAYMIATSAGERRAIVIAPHKMKPAFRKGEAVQILTGPVFGHSKKQARENLKVPQDALGGLTPREFARILHKRWAKTSPCRITNKPGKLFYLSTVTGNLQPPDTENQPSVSVDFDALSLEF